MGNRTGGVHYRVVENRSCHVFCETLVRVVGNKIGGIKNRLVGIKQIFCLDRVGQLVNVWLVGKRTDGLLYRLVGIKTDDVHKRLVGIRIDGVH